MSRVEIQFIGSGGAFGHGGRLQACISLRAAGFHALLDIGATSLVGFRRYGVDPSEIDAVLISHYHADHHGGLPFLILDGQFTKRTRPLVIAGSAGVRQRVIDQMEAAIPTLSRTIQRYPIDYVDLTETPTAIGPLAVRAIAVAHTPGSDPIAMRIEIGDVTIAYTGDTEWTPALRAIASGADLLIAEGYSFTKRIPYHLSYADVVAHRAELDARRIVLTHLGAESLEHLGEMELECADDGMRIHVDRA